MTDCQFPVTKYFDYEHECFIEFRCNEQALPGSFLCVFHDKNYFQNEDRVYKVTQRLSHKIANLHKEPLVCIGYNLKDLDLVKRGFAKSVYFIECNFYGYTNFREVKFYRKAIFSKAKFHGEANFEGSIFYGLAEFDRTEFVKGANFWATKFRRKGQANFYQSVFCGILEFTGALFEGYANFMSSKFQKEVSFNRTTFSDEVRFNESEFYGKVDFVAAEILKVEFIQTAFYQIATFNRAKFRRQAKFIATVFQKETHFIASEFDGITNFSYLLFESGNKIIFDVKKLSRVSFMNSDITRITFGDSIIWGEPENGSKYKIIDEEILEGSVVPLFNWNDILTNDDQNIRLKKFLKRVFNLDWIEDIQQFVKLDNKTLSTHYVCFPKYLDTSKLVDKVVKNHSLTIKLVEHRGKFVNANIKIDNEFVYNFAVKEKKNKIDIYASNYGYHRPSLEGVMAIYRNLRENYEYRLRYDEASKFFIREMELKRKYNKYGSSTKLNNWFLRHFSLTALYYHFSTYGESVAKPALVGAVIVGLSTLFWLIQNNPISEPSLTVIANNNSHISNSVSNFINVTQILNNTHSLTAFERSIADFLPVLTTPSNIKIGVIDFVVKIVGGTLTFVLLGVGLRRKFERRFRH